MPPPIDRTWWNNLVDDDGSGTVGTIWKKSVIAGLLDAIDGVWPVTTKTFNNLTEVFATTNIATHQGVWVMTVQGPGVNDLLGFVYCGGGGIGIGFYGAWFGPGVATNNVLGSSIAFSTRGTGDYPYILRVNAGSAFLEIARNGAGTIAGNTIVKMMRLL